MDNWVFSGSQHCGMLHSWSFPAQCFLWICASPPDFNSRPPLHSPLSLPDVFKREGWTEGMWKILKSSNHLFVFHQWWAWNLFLKPWKQNKTNRLFPEKNIPWNPGQGEIEKKSHKPRERWSNFNPLKSPQISQLGLVSDPKICMYFCLSCLSVRLSPLLVCREVSVFFSAVVILLLLLCLLLLGLGKRSRSRVEGCQHAEQFNSDLEKEVGEETPLLSLGKQKAGDRASKQFWLELVLKKGAVKVFRGLQESVTYPINSRILAVSVS